MLRAVLENFSKWRKHIVQGGRIGMIIQHNIQAMNGKRILGRSTKKLRKSTEKLSSGYCINRAGDDAAGLAISEKMRGQIRGLNRATENVEEGISLIQTADGALAEVSDMLHRIKELSVQAANDTNTKEDREAIQMEINEIIHEVDRIGNTTEFNTIPLFKGEKLFGVLHQWTKKVIHLGMFRLKLLHFLVLRWGTYLLQNLQGGRNLDFVRL